MALSIRTKRLDIPIPGVPAHAISEEKHPVHVALCTHDYPGVQPVLQVEAGDAVKRGTPLFKDGLSGVLHTSPGAGTVAKIHRDASGTPAAMVIELNAREQAGTPEERDFQPFPCFPLRNLALCTGREVKALLLESGLWTALRTRPFGHVADPHIESFALFINAMDTEPLAPSMDAVAVDRAEDLSIGALAVSKLTNGYVFYCKAFGDKTIPPPNIGVMVRDFPSTHPYGTVGVQIHQLEPAGRTRPIWHLGVQDVLAIGALIRTGRLDVSRVVALSGPGMMKPRLIRTRVGASLEEITTGELHPGPQRIISGSLLSGRAVTGGNEAYLGRYHQQVCALPEIPGSASMLRQGIMSMLSPFRRGKPWELSTGHSLNARSILPLGWYDQVFPMALPVTHLLSALLRRDYAEVEALGGLELEEEDLALCSYVCPENIDFGCLLREALTALQGGSAS